MGLGSISRRDWLASPDSGLASASSYWSPWNDSGVPSLAAALRVRRRATLESCSGQFFVLNKTSATMVAEG
jgi:hypothetical protein